MSDKQSVDYQVGGVANGVPINIKGRGHIGPVRESGRQRLDIELYVDVVPLGFDPALLGFGATEPRKSLHLLVLKFDQVLGYHGVAIWVFELNMLLDTELASVKLFAD